MTTFFFNTWEEYYIGELVLPIFNGVEEGSIYVSGAYILSGIYGSNLFLKEINFFEKFSLKFGEINGLIVFIGGCLFTISSFFSTLFKISKNKTLKALKNSLI